MSSEADRPIERELRAHAARRKAQAEQGAFELHPVTRNVLRVEVEREFGARRKAGAPAGGAGWWLRVAFAGGGLVLLVLAGVLFWPAGAPDEMALLEPDARKEGTAPEVIVDDPVTVRSDAMPPRAAGTAPGATGVAASQELVLRFAGSAANETALPAAGAPPVMVAPAATRQAQSPTPARSMRIEETALSGRAASADSTAPATTVVAPFQGEFDVHVLDDIITIVDADASSYRGRLIPIDPAGTGADIQTLVDPSTGVPVDSSDPRFPDLYRRYSVTAPDGSRRSFPRAAQFTVMGTNRLAQLAVVFSGRMLVRTQAAPPTATTPPGGSYFQIKGTALVGNDASFTVDASTAPQ